MSFSIRIILADYGRTNGEKRVYLRAIIDRRTACIGLEFYIPEKDFDARSGRVKSTHPNAEDFNTEIILAIAKANSVAAKLRLRKQALTPPIFKAEFKTPSYEIDLIAFIKKELALREPSLQPNTVRQHQTVINKFELFQKRITWAEITPELFQRFKNVMIKKGLMPSSIDKNMKILKNYTRDAKKQGFEFTDPFQFIKIRSYKSNRMSLTEVEVQRLDQFYEHNETLERHKKVMRYFLFSCYTGLRISDIKRITWNNVHDNMLIYVPRKTKGLNNEVRVPMTKENKYLPTFTPGNHPIFDTFSDAMTNRMLKEIAVITGIRKNITYHTARHTFGTLMAEGGHLVETQKMMGHGNIKTTMEYVHTSTMNLIKAKRKRFKHNAKNLKEGRRKNRIRKPRIPEIQSDKLEQTETQFIKVSNPEIAVIGVDNESRRP